MKKSLSFKEKSRLKRHDRIKKKVYGSPERPRLCVHRSSKHIYAQIINDVTSITIASASSCGADFSAKGSTVEGARAVGALAAKRAKEKGVEQVVFDRGGYQYHGRVKALADAAREAGLRF